MAAFVLDCSVALSWFLPRELARSGSTLLDQAAAEGAVVPGHWRLEIGNALLMAERRKRITPAQRRRVLVALDQLAIVVDAETADRAWGDTLNLAGAHRLTLYDAAYLEVAQRLALPLATLDAALRKAGKAIGLALLGA